jgi:hypothetical protein
MPVNSLNAMSCFPWSIECGFFRAFPRGNIDPSDRKYFIPFRDFYNPEMIDVTVYQPQNIELR